MLSPIYRRIVCGILVPVLQCRGGSKQLCCARRATRRGVHNMGHCKASLQSRHFSKLPTQRYNTFLSFFFTKRIKGTVSRDV
jgi:hypothetical protein